MKNNKKNILRSIIGVLALSFILTSCGQKPTENTSSTGNASTGGEAKTTVLSVGATPEPHAQILKVVEPLLKEEGIELKIVEFTDYILPNIALSDGEIDANFFQHAPYMNSFAESNNTKLQAAANVHVEPLGLYSKKLTSIDELNDGAKIAIPNDPTNGGRALLLLQQNGFIKLAENAGLEATEKDIVENPKNISFVPLDAPQLPRSLDDVDASIINTNYALEAGLNPLTDALILENEDSPYANILAVRPDNANEENIQKLVKALTSPEVKNFINEKYKGAIIPAF